MSALRFLRALCSAALILPLVSKAAIVTQMGDDVVFTYDDSTKFGTGIVVGNTISFSPDNFRAEVIPGSGFDFDNDVLDIDITVKDGLTLVLDSITTTEVGDYALFGSDTFVSASLYTEVDSNTWGAIPVNAVTVDTGNITTPNDNTLSLWNLTNINNWGWENETSVTFTIQNNLTAYAGSSSEFAWIQKKDGTVSIDVQVVPLPGAAIFFISAMGSVFVLRRKTG